MRKLSILLLLLILSTSLMASCSAKSGVTEVTTTGDAATTQAETTVAAPEVIDFGGYEFRIYCYESKDFLIYFSEGETGEPINDAVYQRNSKIAENYNIKISGTSNNNIMSTLSQCALSGDDFTDIAIYPITWHYSNGLTASVLNMLDIKSLRLDQAWWDQDFSDEFTINGILQAVSGDVINGDETGIGVMLYNQNMFEDLYGDRSEINTLVQNGDWTFDTFFGYVKGAASDTNGDGTMTADDRWGMICNGATLNYLYIGSGYDTIQKDADGKLTITANSEKSYEIFSKIFPLMTTPDITKPAESYTGSYTGAFVKFMEDKALFIHLSLGDLNSFREMKSDFGIIPAPKVDITVDHYNTEVSQYSQVVYIPITVGDAERTGLILEALAYESQFDMKTALYDSVLQGKIARDEDSVKSLDILFGSKTWSVDDTAGITGFRGMLSTLSTSKKDTFASSYASIEQAAQTNLEKFLALYSK